MRVAFYIVGWLLLLVLALFGQGKRLWVLRSPGEMAEYDPATFAAKQTVKVPAEAVQSPEDVSVNSLGQILFETPVTLPLSEEDGAAAHKIWFWNGHAATTIDQGLKREVIAAGSNHAVTESAPMAYLSADGTHLFWFANEARRLEREGVDLSTTTTWQAWRTDLNGAGREEIWRRRNFPTVAARPGPVRRVVRTAWCGLPENGVDKFFLMTQFVAGQTAAVYKASALYREDGAKWTATPLRRAFAASAGRGERRERDRRGDSGYGLLRLVEPEQRSDAGAGERQDADGVRRAGDL